MIIILWQWFYDNDNYIITEAMIIWQWQRSYENDIDIMTMTILWQQRGRERRREKRQ